MYTGTVIEELMQMVARLEDHAQDVRPAAALEREEKFLASHFAYHAHGSQPMMIGVA
jgi:hypothetical protein